MIATEEELEWRDEAEEWRGTTISGAAVEILADDFSACFQAGATAERRRLINNIRIRAQRRTTSLGNSDYTDRCWNELADWIEKLADNAL